jgi:hypothetical protein
MLGLLKHGGEMEHDVDVANVAIEWLVAGEVQDLRSATPAPNGLGFVAMQHRAGDVTAVGAQAAEQCAADEAGGAGHQHPSADQGATRVWRLATLRVTLFSGSLAA